VHTSSPRRLLVPVVSSALLAALVAVGLLAGRGELAPLESGLFDPGAVVRYGLPAARAVHDLAASVTIGLLVLATWCVGPGPGSKKAAPDAANALTGIRQTMTRMAVTAATAWLVAAVAVLLLTAADVSGFRLTDPGFSNVVISFVTQIDLGRALGVSALVVAVVLNLTLMASKVVTLAWAAVLSLFAVLPLALAGHASGTTNHINSVDSLALHLVGVTVWVGGLAALLLVSGRLGAQRNTVIRRYSTLAGWCFLLVAVSGLINAGLRLGSLSALGTSYGLLIVGKAVALGLLGVAGLLHRRLTIGQLEARPRLFVRLAVVETLVMGVTMGLAVALSRSAPPIDETDFDPASILLGFPAPPPVTVGRYLTAFYPETLWIAVVCVIGGLYAAGVVRLHRRGDRWPVNRLLFWLAGCLLLAWVTNGGPAVYSRVHFSTHMIQHMTLMVAVPLLLVFGAPITLAMRALKARTDGSFGPREMLLMLVHARILRLIGHPVVAALLFTGSLTVFYYSGLFELAMFTHAGHVLMTAHFLLSGYLFIWSLVGIDPGPAHPPYPFRLVLLLMTLGFHAFFGISLMASDTVLAPDWWHALGRLDDAALVADQQNGGAIAWAAGDIPSLLLGLALLISWIRSDAQETKRIDRKADRDGDAELRLYNERLQAMGQRDRTS